MAKKVTAMIKLQVPAAKATPAPPIGPALGQHGVNIPGFCKEFNERTSKDAGLIIPVVITVFSDRTFTFITKTPPVPVLIKKELGIETRQRPPQPRQGRQDHQGADSQDRRDQAPRCERNGYREHREHGRRYRALHGITVEE